jgi:hypothetical protein
MSFAVFVARVNINSYTLGGGGNLKETVHLDDTRR